MRFASMRFATFVFGSAALLSATAETAAQSVAQSVPFSGPVHHVGTYDVATHTLTPAVTPGGDGALVGVVFDNTAFNGSYFPPGVMKSVLDWGTLSAGGLNTITEVQIGYATSSTDPVTLEIGLHVGATGFGVPGNSAGYTLTGLPGSASGQIEGFTVDVVLPETHLMDDGPIGWSYAALDDVTGPLTVGPPVEAGVVNAFDHYGFFEGYIGTFWFGGTPFASFHMRLTGTDQLCQPVTPGFEGDGALELSVCGDPLTGRDKTAQLVVDGAPAHGVVYLVADVIPAPIPFAGGQLVPSGLMLVQPVMADAQGHVEAMVRGDTTTVAVHLQAVAIDPSTPSGKALSELVVLFFGS